MDAGLGLANLDRTTEPDRRVRWRRELRRWLNVSFGCLLVPMLIAPQAQGALAVIANRTPLEVTLHLSGGPTPESQVVLSPGEVAPLRLVGSLAVSFSAGGAQRRYAVEPHAAYCLIDRGGGDIAFERIGFNEPPSPIAAATAAAGADPISTRPSPGPEIPHTSRPSPSLAAPELSEVPVKILVDEEEPARREVWEKRLIARVAACSAVTERLCFVRFKVVATGTWRSDDSIRDFPKSLAEFSRKVDPSPAWLAVGFSSQFQLARGQVHLGGIAGPLEQHLLIREWSRYITEPERMEVLLHELGHFLGAVHSPEPDSVMRPVLGDRLSRSAKFRIGFDPVNALAMCLVRDELASGRRATLGDLQPSTLGELRSLYATMAQALPKDPAATRYMELIDRARQTTQRFR